MNEDQMSAEPGEDWLRENDHQTSDAGADGSETFDPAAELERLATENAALKEQALRYAAEAENTRRRAERESNDARAFAIQRFARDLLDASDNLGRALMAAPRETADPVVQTFITGIEMTEKALQSAFERNGLKRVDPARGEKFDPNLHQAMMEQPAADVPPGSVLMVMQVGYELFGRIVRPALVAVSAKAPAAAEPASAPNPYASAASHDAGAGLDTKA